ncbi:MAG: hypothetical protein FWG50_12975 [Kiritimatiellaeota bacterium]|nr:hypothetical protein [Kiritimatiellota bacterium]
MNWVDIRQYDMTGRKNNVRVRMDGNGIVTVWDGASERIGNPFANDTKKENWSDLRETRYNLSEEDILLVFQNLVNNGLLVKHEKPLFGSPYSTNETTAIFVSANIQNKMTSSPDPVFNEELLEALKMTVMMFYTPRPRPPAQRRTITAPQ